MAAFHTGNIRYVYESEHKLHCSLSVSVLFFRSTLKEATESIACWASVDQENGSTKMGSYGIRLVEAIQSLETVLP